MKSFNKKDLLFLRLYPDFILIIRKVRDVLDSANKEEIV